jgi:SAM-dependent methyltransferase
MRRFTETVRLLQRVERPGMRIVDVGSYGSLLPALKDILGLDHVTITQPPRSGQPRSEDTILSGARKGDKYTYHVDRFDLAESFPYADGAFDLVIFTEVLEHLTSDPMHTLSEINRITATGGWIVLSTPNCASTKSILSILAGGHPFVYGVFTKDQGTDRHNREYVPCEVATLLEASGFDILTLETINVYGESRRERIARIALTAGRALARIRFKLSRQMGYGDSIFALARKGSGVRDRYPAFLYA